MYPIILASTSIYRKQALDRLGLRFDQVGPNVDEDIMKNSGLAPQAVAEQLANAKATDVARHYPNAIVIGSDQLVDFDGDILGKPGSAAAACRQLGHMAGKAHRLITAVTVISPDRNETFTDITTLTMRDLDEAAIKRYVERDAPFDCAGAYRIEGAGIALFEHIDSQDHSAITGLPLIGLVTILRRLGHAVP